MKDNAKLISLNIWWVFAIIIATVTISWFVGPVVFHITGIISAVCIVYYGVITAIVKHKYNEIKKNKENGTN